MIQRYIITHIQVQIEKTDAFIMMLCIISDILFHTVKAIMYDRKHNTVLTKYIDDADRLYKSIAASGICVEYNDANSVKIAGFYILDLSTWTQMLSNNIMNTPAKPIMPMYNRNKKLLTILSDIISNTVANTSIVDTAMINIAVYEALSHMTFPCVIKGGHRVTDNDKGGRLTYFWISATVFNTNYKDNENESDEYIIDTTKMITNIANYTHNNGGPYVVNAKNVDLVEFAPNDDRFKYGISFRGIRELLIRYMNASSEVRQELAAPYVPFISLLMNKVIDALY